jgi:hypothetical protein
VAFGISLNNLSLFGLVAAGSGPVVDPLYAQRKITLHREHISIELVIGACPLVLQSSHFASTWREVRVADYRV